MNASRSVLGLLLVGFVQAVGRFWVDDQLAVFCTWPAVAEEWVVRQIPEKLSPVG